ncbi:MAG TPA: methylmalonyl-CoA mutase family protein, partial [Dehalococcoidales bacterium]|nr:methylmalonyl-CoA mutase family protein [Dehalococcoidales bacterium]
LEVLPNRMVSYPYDASKRAQAEDRQLAKLRKVKKERDNAQVKKLLAQLEEAARDEKTNLMPLTVEAVRAYATIGEVSGSLKNVFGEYSSYGTL